MNRPLSRRDFLKLMALVPPSMYMSGFVLPPSRLIQDPNAKNVLIILFDALSARNIALYGYQRDTMPNLARLAERSIVYHNHHAGGNFTTPGTASLLTGTYPWTHRAINLGYQVIEQIRHRTIFSAFDGYYRTAYSHNNFVNAHLEFFFADIDYLKPQKDLFVKNGLALDRLFTSDADIASVAWERIVKKGGTGNAYSLFLSALYTEYEKGNIKDISALFPRGISRIGEDDYFLLEEGIDWVKSQLKELPQPFLSYYHFLPPHHPYCPRQEFVNAFLDDGVGYLINKPKSIFNSNEKISLTVQSNERRRYDEFVLYADSELGRLYDYLQESGLLENTWVVFTSDHGEMFERGVYGHRTPVLYEPVIHVPLLIMEPGQKIRRDVFTPTSAVDVVPSLLKVTGQDIPDWFEGTILPPFAGTETDSERSIFAVEAKLDPWDKPLNPVSTTIIKGSYKLIYLAGYEELGENSPSLELYDLENDPEELNDLHAAQPDVLADLKNELLTRMTEADRPYQNK